MRRVFIKRLIPALLVFGAVHVYIDHQHRWDIASWILARGEAAGCMVVREGGVAMGSNGPFFGDDRKTRAWNAAYRHGPWVAAAGASYLAAISTYGLCAGPLGRTRAFGYRGPTRCGTCGYALAGLPEPRCPECGRTI